MLTQRHLQPLTSTVKSSYSHMHIPVHSPWLPGYINDAQAVPITLTMAGLFLDRPHCIISKALHDDSILLTFSTSSFTTTPGTWGNCSFGYSNMLHSHLYLCTYTVPTFGVILSLYLINFHMFFKVPTQMSFLQEDPSTPKAGLGGLHLSSPFPLSLIRLSITLDFQHL